MNYYLTLFLLILAYFHFWFFISFVKKRKDLADTAWGLGFVFLAWSAFIIQKNYSFSSLLVNLAITTWGLRLAIHIYSRNRKKTEDSRYLVFKTILDSYLKVYLFQSFLLYLVSLPLLFINQHPPLFSPLFYLGLLIWLFGFIFESLSDYQLRQFINNPNNKGRLMTKGLWRYSRHPNYFGEVAIWWGIYLTTLPSGFWTVIGPLTISYLILFVSGIPLLEKKYTGRPDFETYKQQTSLFFPLPPKK